MSYIDVVQYTSLSRLIHAWPYVTKRCSVRLKDKEAEIACETGSDHYDQHGGPGEQFGKQH